MNLHSYLGIFFAIVKPTFSLRAQKNQNKVVIDNSLTSQPHERKLSKKTCVNKMDYYRYSQKYALMSLFATFGYEDYDIEAFDVIDECQWIGVTCNEEGLVTRLILNGNVGNFDIAEDFDNNGKPFEELNLLVHLEWLDLSGTNLSGEFPVLKGLDKLKVLDVSKTLLTGRATDKDVCSPKGSTTVVSYTPSKGTLGFDCRCDTKTKKICNPVPNSYTYRYSAEWKRGGYPTDDTPFQEFP